MGLVAAAVCNGSADDVAHDVFHPDGKPYREREVEIIRSLTSGEIPISSVMAPTAADHDGAMIVSYESTVIFACGGSAAAVHAERRKLARVMARRLARLLKVHGGLSWQRRQGWRCNVATGSRGSLRRHCLSRDRAKS